MGYELGHNKDYALRRYRSIEELPKEEKDANGVVVRHGEAPIRTAKEAAIKWLNENLKAPDNLGYELNDQTKSRLFVMRQDKNGTFRKMSLDEAGIELHSRAFWEESQLGGVFAYPSGSKEPVQIQATRQKEGRPSLTFSKPLSADELAPVTVPKPNFFKRLLNRINKNWFKAECEEYNRQAAPRDSMKNEIEARDKQTCERELAETRSAEKAKENEARRAKMDKLVAQAEARAKRTEIGMQYSEAIFEPEPKIFATEEMLKKYPTNKFPGRTANDEIHNQLFRRRENGKNLEGFMSEAEYNNLTQIGKDQLDLDAIKLGASGKSVTKSDFCSLAMFTCMSTDIALNTDKPGEAMRQGYDPTLHERLHTVAGFSKAQADEITALSGVGMYTTDTFRIPPRSGSGRFIKEVIDVARRRTADALNAYKNGDLEPLGRLLANGVNRQAGNAASEESGFGQEFAGGCESSRKLIDMMNADPRLKDAALKAGMEPKNLQVVEGLGKLCELDKKACAANLELVNAAKNGVELTPERKQQLTQDIVAAELAVNLMTTENKNKDNAKVNCLQQYTGLDVLLNSDQEKDLEYQKHNLPDGKLWYISAMSASLPLKGLVRGKPDSVTLLNSPTGLENLQKTAAELVKQQHLAEKSPEEISAKLAIEQEPYGRDLKFADHGLSYMKEHGMLEPKVMETIRKELKTHATEKMLPEADKQPEKQAQKQAEKQAEKLDNKPQAAVMGA